MKNILLVLALVLVAPDAGAAETKAPTKKGVAGNLEVARALKASWYYNWGPRGVSEPGLEFVPMIKGKGHVTDRTLEAIKASGAKALLCFNEPERADQGDATVEEVLDLWPKLMATGLRLGSPAPSSDGKGVAWLEQFMAGVKKRKLRVDFIAVHWYRSAKEDDFQRWLRSLKAKWDRPIWVTEFNAHYTKDDKDRFAERAFKMLDRERVVERYAYMDCGPGAPGGLWKDSSRQIPSELGLKYRDR
jgi:hypothetical protein